MLENDWKLIFPASPNWYNSCIFDISPNKDFFIYAANNNIIVLDANTYNLKSVLIGHNKRITVLCFCDTYLCVSGSINKTIQLWDISKGFCLKTIFKRPHEITAITHFKNAINGVIIGDKNGNISIWPISTNEKIFILKTKMPSEITCLKSSPNFENLVVVGCLKGTVIIIDYEKDCAVNNIACTQNQIHSLNWISQIDSQSKSELKLNNAPQQISIYFEIIENIKDNKEYIKVDTHVNYEKVQKFHSFEIYPYEPLNLVYTSITYNIKIITFPSHQEQKSLILAGSGDQCLYLWNVDKKHDNRKLYIDLINKFYLPNSIRNRKQDHANSRIWIASDIFPSNSPKSDESEFWILGAGLIGNLYAWKIKIAGCQKQSVKMSNPIKLTSCHLQVIFQIMIYPDPLELFKVVTVGLDRNIAFMAPSSKNIKNKKIHENTFRNLKLKMKYIGIGGEITCLEMFKDKTTQILVVGCGDKTVRYFCFSESNSENDSDSDMNKAKLKWRGIKDKITSLDFHPMNSEILAFGCTNGNVGLLRKKDDILIYPFNIHKKIKKIKYQAIDKEIEDNSKEYIIFTLGEEGNLMSWPKYNEEHFHNASEYERKEQKKNVLSPLKFSTLPENLIEKLQGFNGIEEKIIYFEFYPNGKYLTIITKNKILHYNYSLRAGYLELLCKIHCDTNHSDIMKYSWKSFSAENAFLYAFMLDNDGMVTFIKMKKDMSKCISQFLIGQQKGFLDATWTLENDDLNLYTIRNNIIELWDISEMIPECLSYNEINNIGTLNHLTLKYTDMQNYDTLILSSEQGVIIEYNFKVPIKEKIKKLEAKSVVKIEKSDEKKEEKAKDDIPNISKKKQKKANAPHIYSKIGGEEIVKAPIYTKDLQKGNEMLMDVFNAIYNPNRKLPELSFKNKLIPEFEHVNFYESPIESLLVLNQELSIQEEKLLKATETIDKKVAEKVAIQHLWQKEYTRAADILFQADAMTGEFISLISMADEYEYCKIVKKYIKKLIESKQYHLAVCHAISIDNVDYAVNIYKEAGMIHDAIQIASLNYIKEDKKYQKVYYERGMQELMGHDIIGAVSSFLIANKFKEAIQALLSGKEMVYLNLALEMILELIKYKNYKIIKMMDIKIINNLILKCMLYTCFKDEEKYKLISDMAVTLDDKIINEIEVHGILFVTETMAESDYFLNEFRNFKNERIDIKEDFKDIYREILKIWKRRIVKRTGKKDTENFRKKALSEIENIDFKSYDIINENEAMYDLIDICCLFLCKCMWSKENIPFCDNCLKRLKINELNSDNITIRNKFEYSKEELLSMQPGDVTLSTDAMMGIPDDFRRE